jgi:hypothetical protein
VERPMVQSPVCGSHGATWEALAQLGPVLVGQSHERGVAGHGVS